VRIHSIRQSSPPDQYGDKLDVKAEVSGRGGGPIAIDVLHKLFLQPAVLIG
jgi:hypothetical protein